ncbi:MAG: type II methionyl aminopeptidase [Candidatus Diapherotrites archaeon]|nr:type II methionyl aminopeptidase [Candidatus Micrarchaeota archaeon]
MDKKEAEKYIKAGKILAQVQKKARKSIKIGGKLLDIAEMLESEITSLDKSAKPAFPVNLSKNNYAAHYTPSFDDETTADKGDVIKVDIGVHIDGYIADSAFTIDLSGEHGKMVEAAEQALENAVSLVKEDVELRKIGAEIERTIKSYGFKPVHNLSGHGLMPYITHAQPSIPNIDNNDDRVLEDGMCIAIEPFATDGKGSIREGVQAEIFQLEDPAPVRSMHARKILEFIDSEYETLPFAERWLIKGMKPSLPEFSRKAGLRELMQKRCIRAFPILHEEAGAIVTQAETSVLLHDGKVIRLL